MAEGIKVCVRVRPFNKRELEEENGGEYAFTINRNNSISVQSLALQGLDMGDGPKPEGEGVKIFSYDVVMGSDPNGPNYGSQKEMFDAVGMPLIENALDAYNGTMFAYGQTGAGKSHSVMGFPKDAEQKGILPRSCEWLFEEIKKQKETSPGFTSNVIASYLEIYNEKLTDLLVTKSDKNKELQVRMHPQHGPHVPGLTEAPITAFEDCIALLDFGQGNRIIAATNMNATSSRSHAVFTVGLHLTKMGKESQAHIHFVDLAGSERQKKTGAAGDRLKEGIAINQSLTALGRVIAALTSGKKGQVPPFRESKLTLLLKEALSGNSRTTLVAAASPSLFNIEETVGTLEFASRCKTIKTSAKKNEVDRKDLIEALEAEKAAIEAQLKSEVDAREKVMALVDEERSRKEALQAEMDAIQNQLQRAKEIEEKMEQLQAEGFGGGGGGTGISDEALQLLEDEKEQARLQLEMQRQLMETADEANKAEIAAHMAMLESEMAEKEALAMERELVLMQLAQEQAEKEKAIAEQAQLHELQLLEEQARYEMEKAQIEADAQRVKDELAAEKARLAQAAEGNRAEVEAAIKMLEVEQANKEALAAEREMALEQVKAANEERRLIEQERAAAHKELETQRQKLAAAEDSKKKEIEAAIKLLESEQADKEKLNRERAEALEMVAKAEQEKARVQLEIEAEKLKAAKELEEQRKKLADADEAGRKQLEENIKKLQEEQAAKESLDKERVEALKKAAEAEQERLKIEREKQEQAAEIEQQKAKLAEATEANKKEIEKQIEMLQQEQKEKYLMQQERAEALAQVARAEQERAKLQAEMQADRERAAAELEKEKSRLAQASEGDRAEIQETMKRLEAERAQKEQLSRDRAAALEQVAAAEEERAKIQREREIADEKAEKALAMERQKLADAEEAAKEEIESAIRRLEQEQQSKNQLAQERAAALEQVAKAERERAQLQAERDRMERELQEERVRLMEQHGQTNEETEKALQKLQEEQEKKERMAKEREEALEQVSRAEQERAQIKAEAEKALQAEMEMRSKLEQADEANKAEIEATLKKLQEEQEAKEKASKEREETLKKLSEEQASREAALQEKQEAEEKALKEEAAKKKAQEEVEMLRKEKENKKEELLRLQKEKEEQAANEKKMQERLEELKKTAETAEKANKEKAMMEEEMEKRLKSQKDRDEEMAAIIADLNSRLEKANTVSTNQEEIDKRAKEQLEAIKKAQDSQSGGGNLTDEEREMCPFIRKLTTDTVQGVEWKIFIDQKQTDGVTLGSDGDKAQIMIKGTGVQPVHCKLWTRKDWKEVYVQSVESAPVRVNGFALKPGVEKELKDGDKLAIGRSSANSMFFDVEIPRARNEGLRNQNQRAEERLQKAMEEVENSLELDDKTKEIVHTAQTFIQQKFGNAEALAFGEQAKKASAEVMEANEILKNVDEKLRGNVIEYELSVLFDTHGLPILSVVARKKPENTIRIRASAMRRTSTDAGGIPSLLGARDGALDVKNVWTLATFKSECLPWIREADHSIEHEGFEVEDPDDDDDWRFHVWGDVPISKYKHVLEKLYKAEKKAKKMKDEDEEQEDSYIPWWLGGANKQEQKRKSLDEAGGMWTNMWQMLGGNPGGGASGAKDKSKQIIKQATKGFIKAVNKEEKTKKKQCQVTVPKLLGGKLGVKLKNGMHVVGFDDPQSKDFGWALHDEIIEVNGRPVQNRDTFAAEYSQAKKAMPIVFTVLRDAKPAKRLVSVGEGKATTSDSSGSKAPSIVVTKAGSPAPSPGGPAKEKPAGSPRPKSKAKGGTKKDGERESRGMSDAVTADQDMLNAEIPIPTGTGGPLIPRE